MLTNHVYGNWDLFGIAIRRFKYLAYRVFKKVTKDNSHDDNEKKLLIYKIENHQEYADFILKLLWYIPDENYLKKSTIVIGEKFDTISPSPFLMALPNSDFARHIPVQDDIDLSKVIDKKTIVLVTNQAYVYRPRLLKHLSKIELIDPYYFSYVEAITWQNLYFNLLDNASKQHYRDVSRTNFLNLLKKFENRNSAGCFLTGPSFDNYKNYDFSNIDLKIICNSIVKNREFLSFIGGPDILVFADPVFHFGVSRYAESFRQCVVEVVKKYKCYVFVPITALPLMQRIDSSIAEYFIGIEYNNDNYNFPDASNFFVKDNANILTNLMIPLGSSLAETIYIFGADGRNKNEKYFWHHSKTAQFNDLMSSVFETHPSFFRDRDYADYYEQHCKTVKELLSYGEKRGKQYFSLTPSFIPALHEREKLN